MFFRIVQIVKKELIQTLRDKRAFGIILVAPLIQLLIFGYVATTDIKQSAAVICDFDQSPASRELIRKFTASGYFEDKFYNTSQTEIDRLIDSGDAVLGIIIPPDFQDHLKTGREGTVVSAVDGGNPNRPTL